MNSQGNYLGGLVAEPSRSILQINSSDIAGGAAKVARDLSNAYRIRGHNSWLAVGHKVSRDPNVIPIANDAYRFGWTRMCLALEKQLLSFLGNGRGIGRFASWLHWWISQPKRTLERQMGREDFDYPASRRLLDLPPERPDLVHCHNLHGDYFDLRLLPSLSQAVPVILTLHDAWMLSGHCAHSLGCDRWKTGCGKCPDLKIYPEIRRDATAYNWRRKHSIFTGSRLYVSTPSEWLMNKVHKSILAPAVIESRVIHNGVDLSVFHPASKRRLRAKLGLPQGAKILLFAAKGIKRRIWRDYSAMRAAAIQVSESMHGTDVIFIALGEDAPPERVGQTEMRFIPFQNDPEVVAAYYSAADVYVHAAKADTFPTTVLEALACGTPVVATAVGGIPEQIKGLRVVDGRLNADKVSEPTGVLTLPENPQEMADAIVGLLKDKGLLLLLRENAVRDARQRFDVRRQVETYLDWYEQIFRQWNEEQSLSQVNSVR